MCVCVKNKLRRGKEPEGMPHAVEHELRTDGGDGGDTRNRRRKNPRDRET
jgi:hypothetical protein